jgi:hypothetical protein
LEKKNTKKKNKKNKRKQSGVINEEKEDGNETA